ncbi:hypothetical protein OKA06_05515 [Novosphingobium sp. MW5]|nr:hypothetical protein [Novosphingobium sp. MW5]
MAERSNRDRIQRAKGSQPVVFENQTVDALAAMVIALLGEVAVLRDRLDANERLLEAAGLHGPERVDNFQPDAAAKARRAEVRNASYNRVLGAGRDKLVPDLLTEQQRYDETLSAVADGSEGTRP